MTTLSREQVAVVSQHSLLCNGKLRENLSYGLLEITDERILNVLDKVNLKEMVCRLSVGLNTIVRFNGNKFSGAKSMQYIIRELN